MADRRVKLKARSLERGKSAPLIVVTQNEDGKGASKADPALSGLKMGHEFRKRTFYKPTYCHHCSDLLWGLMNQGYQCTVCNFVSHEKCISVIMVDCIHLKAEKIVENVPHKWIGPDDKKKKWCNICRKKINGPSYYCSVCRCYAHGHCCKDSFNDCKRCATHSRISNPVVPHDWIEGNLPSSAKCEICSKSCSTDLCLTGFKCGWCGITMHSSCLDSYLLIPRNQRCTFRDLKFMMLPPSAVSVQIKDYEIGQDVTLNDAECVTTGLFPPTSGLDQDHVFSIDDPDSKGTRSVLIIDGCSKSVTGSDLKGNKKWRKKTVQSINVPKQMSAEELLRISLRKFGISTCPDDFALFELTNVASGNERMLEPQELPYTFQQSYNGPLKICIRMRADHASEVTQTIKIYNNNTGSVLPFVECTIDEKMTFADLIVKCIHLFNLESKSSSDYCIYESSIDICERTVDLADKPLKKMKQLTNESIMLYSSLRYYLSPKEETSIDLYLWKVPSDSLKTPHTAADYLKTLLPSLKDNTFDIGPIFSRQGGFIVNMKCLQSAQRLMECGDSIHPIPTIHIDSIECDREPLLVFVNTKSGGQQGVKLITAFNRHLNPYQVFDLLNGGPIPGLYAFRNVPKCRVLVAGGDGTVGWVLGALDDVKDQCKMACSPPCAIIPLGTGNDLARALKWGSGYTDEKIMQLLYTVEDADSIEFDRWTIDFQDPLDMLTDFSQSKRVIMNNYFGIGIDGEIALDFHQAREENPEKFNSRLHNKGVYLQLGVQKTFSRDSSNDFTRQVSLEVNDKPITLPYGIKGLVVLNIQSWGAGSEPWGNHADQEFSRCNFSDGKIEVMGLNGAMHIGQIKSGIRSGVRIAQGSQVKIELGSTLPVHVDGEAWSQTPVVINISKLCNETKMLVKSSKDHFTRGLLDGQAKSLINKQSIVGHDNMGQLSTRRGHVLTSPNSQPSLLGTSTHTLYIKDRKGEATELTDGDNSDGPTKGDYDTKGEPNNGNSVDNKEETTDGNNDNENTQ